MPCNIDPPNFRVLQALKVQEPTCGQKKRRCCGAVIATTLHMRNTADTWHANTISTVVILSIGDFKKSHCVVPLKIFQEPKTN